MALVTGIKKRFIGADQVDASKILLENASGLRAKKADGTEVALIEIGSDDVVSFGVKPSEIAAIETQIANLIANTDPAALDSLSEIVSAFQAADSTLNGAITALSTDLSGQIAAEVTAREAGDAATLAAAESYVDAEIAEVVGDFSGLEGYAQDVRDDLDQEIIDRAAAVSAEATARQAADEALQAAIDAIVGVKVSKVVDSAEAVSGVLVFDSVVYSAVIANTVQVMVGPVVAHESDQWTVAANGSGKLELSFVAGEFPLEGEKVYVHLLKK